MLYIVATPIGNLGDMTERALTLLRSGEIDLLLCEDTRVTKKLMLHYKLHIPQESFHGHSTPAKMKKIGDLLSDGKNIAYVSDAGTPGISDPGYLLVREAIERDVEIVPLPGPCAFVTALMASGLPTHEFRYLGFLPQKKGRETLFAQIVDSDETIVCYESKHRLIKTLERFGELMPDRYMVVAKELTKMHERFIRGNVLEVMNIILGDKKLTNGEFVLLIAPRNFAVVKSL